MSASPLQSFGVANLITATRLVLVLALWTLPAAEAWRLVWTATIAAVLDAVDGPLARRRGEVSRFGARFDMETDAFLIVTLSVLIWRLDKAGAWVLLAGALRYLFVAAAWIWPWMAANLPESWRRKFTCVVQIATLIAAMSPLVPQPWSALVAGAGLALLVWSFAVDVRWLADRRPR
jgi:phosphatidylglycerophosphate synthase